MYKYTDYFNAYGRIMQFNKNKCEPFHRWYPFVEGYSKDFIKSILVENKKDNLVCLEPFSGSGTTALELQHNSIECYSFEVNPLMYLISRVKLENHYSAETIENYLKYILQNKDAIEIHDLESNFRTLFQNENEKKWNYHINAAKAVKKLHLTIKTIEDDAYREMFMVALASILLDVSNLYRNGKCLSYKKNWKNRKIEENEVYEKFVRKVKQEIVTDIKAFSYSSEVNNKQKLYNMDARVGIEEKIPNNTVDLVITSPPYLNSRDYTDTYMLELKTLGFTKNVDDIRKLREKTLRSHVQIKWDDDSYINNAALSQTLYDLKDAANEKNMWNNSIIDMVRLYFVDLQNIFRTTYKKLKTGGKVYFNVSNSAYFNILVNTLEITASIAENEGFTVREIRKARYLKTSPQQKKVIGSLLEGVIVLEK